MTKKEKIKIKEGVILIAIDECIMDYPKRAVLTLGKEYRVMGCNYEDYEFYIENDEGTQHYFDISGYTEFFKDLNNDNNGWIKIESEDDLPKEAIECRTCFFDGKNYIQGNTGERNAEQLWNSYKSVQITHYQPIEKPKPPLY